MTDTETCTACAAPIIWAYHAATGKAAPLDAEPKPDGNIYLTTDAGMHHRITYALITKATNPAKLFGRKRYTSHFATCPKADRFRRRT